MDESAVNKSLSMLHDKQDAQTESLNDVKVELAKQQTLLGVYSKESEKTAVQLSNINEKLQEYNHQLKVHIEGVQEIKKQNALIRQEIAIKDQQLQLQLKPLEARLAEVEKPFKWMSLSKQGIVKISVVCGAIAGIIGLLKALGLF